MADKWYCKKELSEKLYRFFVPVFDRRYCLRLAAVAFTVTVFLLFFRPCFISGSSMEPEYHDRSFTFIFRLRYQWTLPERGDIVTISYFGRRQLLKRVLALPGDTVEFKDGKLLVNGEIQTEPYVKYNGKWNVDAVTVRPGHCFVAGDNRSQYKAEHIFGEVEFRRITGGPLF